MYCLKKYLLETPFGQAALTTTLALVISSQTWRSYHHSKLLQQVFMWWYSSLRRMIAEALSWSLDLLFLCFQNFFIENSYYASEFLCHCFSVEWQLTFLLFSYCHFIYTRIFGHRFVCQPTSSTCILWCVLEYTVLF